VTIADTVKPRDDMFVLENEKSRFVLNSLRLLNVTSSALLGHEDIFDSRSLDPVSTFVDSYTVLCIKSGVYCIRHFWQRLGTVKHNKGLRNTVHDGGVRGNHKSTWYLRLV
jgi:hypothetical protein